jgi:hypothetical protein
VRELQPHLRKLTSPGILDQRDSRKIGKIAFYDPEVLPVRKRHSPEPFFNRISDDGEIVLSGENAQAQLKTTIAGTQIGQKSEPAV